VAQRVRTYLAGRKAVVEQPMMGGLIFMVNDKMCVGVIKLLYGYLFPASRNYAQANRTCNST
jgi:hypothetical protein